MRGKGVGCIVAHVCITTGGGGVQFEENTL